MRRRGAASKRSVNEQNRVSHRLTVAARTPLERRPYNGETKMIEPPEKNRAEVRASAPHECINRTGPRLRPNTKTLFARKACEPNQKTSRPSTRDSMPNRRPIDFEIELSIAEKVPFLLVGLLLKPPFLLNDVGEDSKEGECKPRSGSEAPLVAAPSSIGLAASRPLFAADRCAIRKSVTTTTRIAAHETAVML